MERIGIIGHFGGDKEFFDGQTVKTKNVERLILESGEYEVYRVDTYLNKTSRIKLLFRALGCFFKCKKIIFMVSTSGVKVMYPLFRFLTKFKKRKMYNSVIGSEILKQLKDNPKYFKTLKMFNKIWFEYQSGTDEIKSYGLDNVKTVANFKYLQPISSQEVEEYKIPKMYNFCTFSRVTKQKGITDAINSIAEINRSNGKTIATLDIYGAIDEEYREEFEKLLSENPSYVNYKGTVDSQKSVETIKNYYALLFPTYYTGEGFAGTVIDGLASGTPTIATDWHANKDIVKDLQTGIIYPREKYKNLTQAIEWSIANKKQFSAMRKNCLAEYEQYSPQIVGKIILDDLKQ